MMIRHPGFTLRIILIICFSGTPTQPHVLEFFLRQQWRKIADPLRGTRFSFQLIRRAFLRFTRRTTDRSRSNPLRSK